MTDIYGEMHKTHGKKLGLYYITSGEKGDMRTLRYVFTDKVSYYEELEKPIPKLEDEYVCDLDRGLKKSIKKARSVIRKKSKLSEDGLDFSSWKGFTSKNETTKSRISDIENGIMPFGKYQGKLIEELDDDYIHWWIRATVSNVLGQMIVQKAIDVANQRDLFSEWDAKRNASSYVGEAEDRFEVFLKCEKISTSDRGLPVFNFLDYSGNKFVYVGGSKSWEEGKHYNVRATIYHKEFKHERVNVMSRPHIIKESENKLEDA